MKIKFRLKNLLSFTGIIGIITILLITFYCCDSGYREFSDIKMSHFSVQKQWQYIMNKLNLKGNICVKDYTIYTNSDGSIEMWYSTIIVTDKNKISKYYLHKSSDSTKITVTRQSEKTADSYDEKYMDVTSFAKYMDIVYSKRKDFFVNVSDKDRYDFYFTGGQTPSWHSYFNYLTVYTIDHDDNIGTISKNQEPLSIIGGCTCKRLDKDLFELADATIVFKK